MEMFNSKIMGNKSPHSIDSQRDQQLILSRSRSPLHSFTNSGFNSPTSDPLDNRDAALIRYSSTAAAAAGVVSSPIKVLGKFHQLLLQQNHHTTNLSSSRGSSSSPLSSIENLKTPPSRSPPGFNTPVKVEEEVLVMDGFLVSSSSPAGGRSKSGLDSPGENNSLYKTEIGRAWDNTKNCPYGFRCQVGASSLISSPPGFTRGKEDVRPTRYSIKNKSSEVCKTFSTVGSCPYGAKCRFVHHGAAVTREATTPSSSTITSEREKNTTLVISPNAPVDKRVIKEEPASSRSFWSPADDNILITKLSITDVDKEQEEEESDDDQNKVDKEVVDAHINDVLYGRPDHRRRRRLPVFNEICSTAEDHDQ